MKRNGSSRAAMWWRVRSPTSTAEGAIGHEGSKATQLLSPLRRRTVGLPAAFCLPPGYQRAFLNASQVLPVYTLPGSDYYGMLKSRFPDRSIELMVIYISSTTPNW